MHFAHTSPIRTLCSMCRVTSIGFMWRSAGLCVVTRDQVRAGAFGPSTGISHHPFDEVGIDREGVVYVERGVLLSGVVPGLLECRHIVKNLRGEHASCPGRCSRAGSELRHRCGKSCVLKSLSSVSDLNAERHGSIRAADLPVVYLNDTLATVQEKRDWTRDFGSC